MAIIACIIGEIQDKLMGILHAGFKSFYGIHNTECEWDTKSNISKDTLGIQNILWRQTVAKGQERKQLFQWTSMVRGYFPRHTETKTWDVISHWKKYAQLLVVPLANPQVLDSYSDHENWNHENFWNPNLVCFAKICTCEYYRMVIIKPQYQVITGRAWEQGYTKITICDNPLSCSCFLLLFLT